MDYQWLENLNAATKGIINSEAYENMRKSARMLSEIITKEYSPQQEEMMKNISSMVQVLSQNTSALSEQIVSTSALIRNISELLREAVARVDFSSILKVNDFLQGIDMGKLISATQRSFFEADQDERTLENIIDSVADNYEQETAEESEIIKVVKSDKSMLSVEEKSLKQAYIQTILAIISLIVAIVMPFITPAILKSSGNNDPQIVNNYDIDAGYDINMINSFGLRIIVKECKPRIKPDCSSKVVGILPVGTVIVVADKYKKWLQVTWTDSDGLLKSGWIQNYKTQEFKK